MPRSRNLKPGFFKNEDLVALGYEAMLCFAGLWTLADREGRLEDRPRRIKAEIFPYTDADVDSLLNSLEEAGFIQRYSVYDSSTAHTPVIHGSSTAHPRVKHDFILIRTWLKHQNPHHREVASAIPAPTASTKSNKPKPNRLHESSTTHGPPIDEPSTAEEERSLPSDSLSLDSLSLDSRGNSPLPPSPGEAPLDWDAEQARLKALGEQTDAEPQPRKAELTRAERITAPEPGVFDVQAGWREFSEAYPVPTGIDAACRWYVSEMARRKPDEQVILQVEIMAGLQRWMGSARWRQKETGELQVEFIPSMDKFLGVPKESDPTRGRMYVESPVQWEPLTEHPNADKGAYLRAQIQGKAPDA